MTPQQSMAPIEPRVSIDDIRHRADALKSKAVAEAKGAADVVFGDDKRTLMIVAGLVVVAASLAFFLGSRSGRSSAEADIFGG